MAASHTSSLAGQNDYYEALFESLGVIETDTVPQFMEMMKVASIAEPIEGPRISVYSSSGGDNGLAADYCSFAGLELPQPDAEQIGAIKPMLPEFGHVSNPFDFTAGYWGKESLLTPMFTTMLAGEYDAGLLVIDYPPLGSARTDTTAQDAMDRALAAAGRATGKPVFHASVNTGGITPTASRNLIAQGIVPLQGLHDAAAVIAKWADHCARMRDDASSGHSLDVPVPYRLEPLAAEQHTVNEAESKRRLAARGLRVPDGKTVSLAELASLPEIFETPMVLKVLHDDVAHKTEVGGVSLNLRNRDEAIGAARRMVENVKRHMPEIRLDNFVLEPMQTPPLAELIIGVKRDPLFGMVLVIGTGGIFVELLKDAKPLLLPVRRKDVEQVVRSLKGFAFLDGFRGRPAADLAPVVDAIMAIASYAEDNLDNLLELDVNPLMVSANGVVAVDALIVEARASA